MGAYLLLVLAGFLAAVVPFRGMNFTAGGRGAPVFSGRGGRCARWRLPVLALMGRIIT